jgi:hypothetical protein
MGKQINLDEPLSVEDREYLKSRGRGYLIPANERRFGTPDDPKEPDEFDGGASAQSPFYDSQKRAKAVYDVGGAPLPDVVLDYNTGRVADRDNGVLVEFTGPGHTPGAADLRGRREPEGFASYEVDENGNPVDDEIDDDIVQKVLEIPNVATLKKELDKKKVSYDKDAKREELENRLAIALQDERDASAGQPGPQ